MGKCLFSSLVILILLSKSSQILENMNPNSNHSSSQNPNFYDSQNQYYSFNPPNFQFIQNSQSPYFPHFMQNSQNPPNFQFTQNSQSPYFPSFMQNFPYPYFLQNMQINSHNLDVDSRTHNSKSTETGSISSYQIPHFSTQPEIGNINLTQEPDEEVGDKRQPWSMEDDKRLAKA